MPGRRIHRTIAAASAGTIALAASRGLPDPDRVAYVLSALLGGCVGGLAPDALEPALHSHHRDLFHSLTVGAGVSLGAAKAAKEAGVDLRAQAAQYRASRMAIPTGDPRRTELAFREYAIYALLGFTLGLAVGYVSHIAADMATPRGVPLLARRLG